MATITDYLNQNIKLKVSENKVHYGILLEIGSDILVIYNGKDYIYFPSLHIQNIQLNTDEEKISLDDATCNPEETLSFRKTLLNSKGLFSEIFVTGFQSIHGYVTNVLNDYFVFYSPVYKTMFIPFQHLKWLIPYQVDQIPYSLGKEKLPVRPTDISLSRTFKIQLQKLIGEIVVFDLGQNTDRIGQLKNINENYIELATARDETIFINLTHLKSVHFQ